MDTADLLIIQGLEGAQKLQAIEKILQYNHLSNLTGAFVALGIVTVIGILIFLGIKYG